MSALSAAAIRLHLQNHDHKKRLVVTPILDPQTQLKNNQAGIDVRLGRVFSLPRAWTHGVAESLGEHSPAAPLETTVVSFGQAIIIHPHQFVLARTMEVVRLPVSLMAYVIGRSSWGRRGLTVATAVAVHPGFAGPITLELKNVGEVPIALYPFDRVAQLIFHDVEGADEATKPTASQFSFSFQPGLGDVRDSATRERISKMVVARSK